MNAPPTKYLLEIDSRVGPARNRAALINDSLSIAVYGSRLITIAVTGILTDDLASELGRMARPPVFTSNAE